MFSSVVSPPHWSRKFNIEGSKKFNDSADTCGSNQYINISNKGDFKHIFCFLLLPPVRIDNGRIFHTEPLAFLQIDLTKYVFCFDNNLVWWLVPLWPAWQGDLPLPLRPCSALPLCNKPHIPPHNVLFIFNLDRCEVPWLPISSSREEFALVDWCRDTLEFLKNTFATYIPHCFFFFGWKQNHKSTVVKNCVDFA